MGFNVLTTGIAVLFVLVATILVSQTNGQFIFNNRPTNDTSFIAEMEEKLFKIQNNITQLNIAAITVASTDELQRRITEISDEFHVLQTMASARNEDEVAGELSQCDESAIRFLRNFYISLDAQISYWQETLRKKLKKEQEKLLTPVILSDIKARYFKSAEKNLIQMDNKAKTQLIIHEIYAHNMSNFKSVLMLAQAIQNSTIAEYVLAGLLHELRANIHLSAGNLMEFIQVADSKNDIVTLREYAEQELVASCADQLRAAILMRKFRGNYDISNLANALFQFDSSLFMEAMYRVIDSVFPRVSKSSLLLDVFHLEEYGQIVNVIIYIYRKLKEADNHDDAAMFGIVDYFRRLSNVDNFPHAAETDRILVKNAIKDIPSLLRNLYFSERFSFVNVEYSQYMFAGNDFISSDQRHVLTSASGGQSSARSWTAHKYTKDVANEFIFGIHTKEFLYASSTDFDSENLYVTTSGYDGDARIFQLELRNNSISIKNRRQNRYLCASSLLFDEGGGKQYVFAPKYAYASLPACRWTVEAA